MTFGHMSTLSLTHLPQLSLSLSFPFSFHFFTMFSFSLRYTDNMELDDAVHTAILTLKEGYVAVKPTKSKLLMNLKTVILLDLDVCGMHANMLVITTIYQAMRLT